jgi:putative intracellular protease/amidase
MDLSGKRALIVTTSHDTLGETGKSTGVFASEMTAPYYAFLDSGMEVDVASIQGGQIPIERQSLKWPIASKPDKRYLKDPMFQSKVSRSYQIDQVDMAQYDIVFLAGGWGAAYDFGQSAELGEKVAMAYSNDAVIGGVCHGPLGLLQAYGEDGELIIEGRRISAVTDKQISELGITHTPMHPERDLRAAGVVFEAETKFRDFLANNVVIDGRIVTGQNQNSATETAVKMMQVLAREQEVETTS